ncbi:coenzyme F420-0:L-glutamate ligase [Streptococcus pseudoporcinus]|uniref:F420-0:gamma-glutamyl ligase n=1 Tax=Streptococcus pseudoporcinus LQ 940-04 TaxID=875093 RepID=G5KBK6_9STRE|nr:coenzyme F420-0:L-glutamate ligase [Streptococcus pseudoporcinus]EFR45376.1 putative F420-0:gamma-glutamyl ligase [Streptococcus pseudoporcinus SPIN 20026]EHI64424.1 putative F420-0:gamma-glutamyl ligase [Streptococcus pseudoporcinus LQ 940-04]VEF92862.1 L-glutamate ligase [Streptococcus pseudoporcinus]
MTLSLIEIANIPEIKVGDRVAEVIAESLISANLSIEDRDIICIASKIVSIAENSVLSLDQVTPSHLAKQINKRIPRKDPRVIELILELANRDPSLLDIRDNYIGCRLANGLKLTSGGIDKVSDNEVVMLPKDSDKSAKKISEYLSLKFKKQVAVIISDSDGREDKRGANQIAIGIFGIEPLRKTKVIDIATGKCKLQEETLCDMLASSAGLLMGQRGTGIPAVIIRGLDYEWSENTSIKEALNG